MMYMHYYPNFLEDWKQEKYADIIGYFADKNRAYIATFCADLYFGGKDTDDDGRLSAQNLIRFAAECAKFENCIVDPEEVKSWINDLQDKWWIAFKAKNDAELDNIAKILSNSPLCKLVTFIGNVLFNGESEAESAFYLGCLAGIFTRVDKR